MNIKKGKVGDVIYDVMTYEEFNNVNRDLYGPIAIEQDGHLYPVKNLPDGSPGYVPQNWGGFYTPVPKDLEEEYSSKNVIDFNSSSIKELIEKNGRLKDMEKMTLACPDEEGHTKYTIHPNDSPEMQILKLAINEKGIDLQKYAHRFGANFMNDKRLLTKNNITLPKMKSFLKNLDMKASLIIEDSGPNVPNPIGKVIRIDLVEGDE